VYGDSAWRYVDYDLARAGRDGANIAAVVSATNPDLSAFRARGGKLLLAHGWSDPALSARATIEYFKAVQRRTPQASSFTRLFLMPGVLHCAGGSGSDDVDYAGIIRRWVEQGEAPSRIIARKLRGTQVVRTHPLCAYPMTARYNGTGSTDDVAAFTCRWAIQSSRRARNRNCCLVESGPEPGGSKPLSRNFEREQRWMRSKESHESSFIPARSRNGSA
jgi:feruloyl esterase